MCHLEFNETSRYRAKVSGFFLPSVTSTYKFYFSSEGEINDNSLLLLEMDIGEGLVRIFS